MLWWLSPTSAAARTTSPLSLSASPDLGRSKEYRSFGKLDSPEGKTNTKMSARVRPQWELPDVLACSGRPTAAPFADLPDRSSGCFSNEYRQEPLRVEVVDTKWQIHRAFARPVTGRRDRREMRRRPTEVDLCRRRSAETLVRAKVRIVDEAYLDLLH